VLPKGPEINIAERYLQLKKRIGENQTTADCHGTPCAHSNIPSIEYEFRNQLQIIDESVDCDSSISSLLAAVDPAVFIANAYNVILKRPLDTLGHLGYVKALQQNRLNKLEVLGRIRYSKEGRRIGVPVNGLFIPFISITTIKMPARLVVYLYSLLKAIIRLPQVLKTIDLQDQYIKQQHIDYISKLELQNNSIKTLSTNLDILQQQVMQQIQNISKLSSLYKLTEQLDDKSEEYKVLRSTVSDFDHKYLKNS
jgi:hypothetical protein